MRLKDEDFYSKINNKLIDDNLDNDEVEEEKEISNKKDNDLSKKITEKLNDDLIDDEIIHMDENNFEKIK